jgi:YqaJ-like viral recombinase domain.
MLEGDALAAWLRERAGKLTASRMADAMDFLKNGEPSKKRSDLMRELLAERLADETARHFVTDAMRWGLEKECDAKAAYEAHTGVFVQEGGFVEHPKIENLGATPDGFVGADGLIETKCPTTPVFLDWVMAGVVPDKHKPQMIVQLQCTRRTWCDFVAYDPRIRDQRRQLFIRRYIPTEAEIAKVEAAAIKFLDELDNLFDAFFSAQAA